MNKMKNIGSTFSKVVGTLLLILSISNTNAVERVLVPEPCPEAQQIATIDDGQNARGPVLIPIGDCEDPGNGVESYSLSLEPFFFDIGTHPENASFSIETSVSLFSPNGNAAANISISTTRLDFTNLSISSNSFYLREGTPQRITISGKTPSNWQGLFFGVFDFEDLNHGEKAVLNIQGRVNSNTSSDTTPPNPNPMTWSISPKTASSTSITMKANTATDINGVEYFFDSLTAGGHDSGWRSSSSYTDSGLTPQTAYSYRVRARDKSSNNNLTAYSSTKSATTSASSPTWVGVIPQGTSCGQYEKIRIHTDDEDRNNANNRSPWIGATVSDGNTTFTFCKVPGNSFAALSSSNIIANHYAVLRLSGNCPVGSSTFWYHFDNENRRNDNWSEGNIAPNVSSKANRTTTLQFCLFKNNTKTMSQFPGIGFSYGVFAASNFNKRLASGWVRIDNEDGTNYSYLGSHSGVKTDAQRIVLHDGNVTIKMVKVR